MPRIKWMAWGSGLGLIALVYQESMTRLVLTEWRRADFDYCYLIPVVAAFLIWERRADLERLPSRPSWAGVLAFAAAAFLLLLGVLGGEFLVQYLSLWCALVGLCWTILGWRKFATILFPVAFLLTAFPPPNYLYSRLTLNMQLLSTALGAEFLHLLGIPAFREGNVIDLGFTQLEVVAACSGLRFLIPLVIVGLLLGYYFRGAWWKRGLFILSTLPLAVVMNGTRIGLTGLLTRNYGPGFAEGGAHDALGWGMFAVSTALLLGLMRLMSRPDSPATGLGLGGGWPVRTTASPWPRLALGLGVLLCAWGCAQYRALTPPVLPKAGDLAAFPLSLNGWEGRKLALDRKFIESLHFTDYVQIDYADSSGKKVDFYVAWYESQSMGESIHSPETCLRGGGWSFERTGAVTVEVSGHAPIRVNRSLLEQGGRRMLAYFWFPVRGAYLTNGVELKLHTFWGSLTQGRTDGALVRVITPLYPEEREEDGARRLEGFLAASLPILDGILPGAGGR